MKWLFSMPLGGLLLALALLGCGGGSGGPVIQSFTAARPVVGTGGSTTLTAVFVNGTAVIDHGVGSVRSGVGVPTGGLAADTVFTLTVSNTLGGFTTATVAVRTDPGPPAPVIQVAAPVAQAGAAGLTASVVQPTADGAYAWILQGGTVTAGAGTAQITYTAGAPGTLELSCTALDTAQVPSPPGTASETILAPEAAPVIQVAAPVAEAGAAGLTASVAQPEAGAVYTWTLQGGTVTDGAGTAQITYTAGAPGTLKLSCTATGAAQVPSAAGTASETIVTPAAPPAITLGGPITAGMVATGATGLTAQVPAQPGCTFQWTLTGGTLGDPTSPQVTFTAGTPGALRLTCTATDAAGGQASATASLEVLPAAPVLQAPATAILGTLGLGASVTAPEAGLAYAWQITGGAFTGATPGAGPSVTFTAGAAGTLTLRCAALNADGVAGPAASQTVIVYGALQHATATPLTSGLTLITGGEESDDGAGAALATAMLFDPLQQTLTATGSLNLARGRHTATLLADGKVLIAGGETATAANPASAVTATAELYDPAAGTFSPIGPMAGPRVDHTATLLPGGQVLIAGGSATGAESLATAELFDPEANTFAAAAPMGSPRRYHTATLLPATGQVLVAGGDAGGAPGTTPLASAELFSPLTATFAATSQDMVWSREAHAACLEPDGTVLLSGGYGALPFGVDEPLASLEYFDPLSGHFNEVDSMVLPNARQGHTATLMATGDVLLFGGEEGAGPVADPVLYTSELFFTRATSFAAPAVLGATATLMPDGKVLIAGGVTTPGAPAAGPVPVAASFAAGTAPEGFPAVIYQPAVLALQVGQAASVAPVANASSLTLANPVWTISPALPAGLSLDPGTGAIHGTPAGPAGSGHYTVTFAFSYDLGGGAGQAICDLWITVS